VEARNAADAMIYSTEKSVKELGDKVDSETKSKVADAISALKKAMETEDVAEIKRLSEELTNVSHKLAEAMYQQASAGQQQAGAAEGSADANQPGSAAAEEDVVDADFEEVKEDDKK
jgi:molecular chaperone DnaK